jgi:hypothetical protein
MGLRHVHIFRDEHRLRVFENTVVRKIFGPKGDDVRGDGRRVHNEELYDLYSSPDIIRTFKSRRMRWAGHVTRMGDRRGTDWVGRPGGRGHLNF